MRKSILKKLRFFPPDSAIKYLNLTGRPSYRPVRPSARSVACQPPQPVPRSASVCLSYGSFDASPAEDSREKTGEQRLLPV